MSALLPFSVIVPAYNAEATLGDCLDAIERLDPAPVQVIVVDDGSTDRSAEIAASKGVEVIRNERNVGQGVARNRAARIATGKFLAFTDADCVVPRNWLARFDSVLRSETYCGVTGPYESSSVDRFLPQLIDRWLRYSQRSSPEAVGSAVTANLAVSRADFEAVGGFPEYRLPWSNRCCVTNEDEEFAHLLTRYTGKLLCWQTDSGVRHAYRPNLRQFLAQQAKFAQSLVVSRARFPSLLKSKTHYSKGRGMTSVVLSGLAVAGLVLALKYSSALLLAIPFALQNLGCVVHLMRTEPTLQRELITAGIGFPFLLATNLAWIKGLAVGAVYAAIGRVYWSVRGT